MDTNNKEWLDQIAHEYYQEQDNKIVKMSKKDRFDLIPWTSLRWAAKVMAFGVGKHGIDVWKTEPIWHQEAAMMRHFSEYMEGNYYDKETGLPALAHCLCRLLFLINLVEKKRHETPK